MGSPDSTDVMSPDVDQPDAQDYAETGNSPDAEASNGTTAEPKEDLTQHAVTTTKGEGASKVAATVVWNAGRTLEEAVNMYGAEVVHAHFVRNADVKLQAQVRKRLVEGATQDEIDKEFPAGTWSPAESRRGERDPLSTINSAFNKLGEDEREQLIRQLAAKAGIDPEALLAAGQQG